VNQKKIDMRVADVLERIRLLRISKKISVENLATGANVSRSYIYYIETKRKTPTLTILFRLADALDVTVEDFFCPCSCLHTEYKADRNSNLWNRRGSSSELFGFLSFLYTNQKKAGSPGFLSWKELYLLLAVREAGSTSISTLSSVLGMSAVDISRTVSDLQSRNILQKRIKSSDHRVVLSTLTDTGHMVLERIEQNFLTSPEKESDGDLETYSGTASSGRLICSFKPVFNTDKEISDLDFFEINGTFIRESPESRTLGYSTHLSRTVYHHFDTVMSVCNTVWKTGKPIRIVLDTEIRGKGYACEFFRTVFDHIVISVRPVHKMEHTYIHELFPYYTFFFGSRPVILVLECATGRILEVNEAAVRFYGWSRRQFLQKTIYEISTNPAAVIRSKLAAGGETGSGSEQVFHVLHRVADGNVQRVEVHLSSCMCGDTRIQYVSVVQDMSAVPLLPVPVQSDGKKMETRIEDRDFLALTSNYESGIEGVNELFKYMKETGKFCNYSPGDRFFGSECPTLPTYGFILEGLFRVYYGTSSGREYTLEYLRSGDIIDSLTFSAGPPEYEVVVEAVIPCRVLVIEQGLFRRRAAVDPHAFEFLYTLGRKRLGAMEKHVMLLLTDNATDRYEQFLNGEHEFTACLRAQEIASYLGITPETLSRIKNAE